MTAVGGKRGPWPAPAPMRQKAIEQARIHGTGYVGAEHFVLALLTQPSTATEVLTELGVTYDRVAERIREQPGTTEDQLLEQPRTLNPAGHQLVGRAEGVGLARDHASPTPEDWLVAIVYGSYEGATAVLHDLGARQEAVLEALRARGVPIPIPPPSPAYVPWREGRRLELERSKQRAIVALLMDRHPPGSEWRWGTNGVPGQPGLAILVTESGIDLDGILNEVNRTAER